MNEDLIKRLERATEGSAHLDLEIAIALGIKKPVYSLDDSYAEYAAKTAPYTTSLDAALTLVPDRSYWRLNSLNEAFCTPCDDIAHGCTPALTLCIAALKARL